MKKIIFLLACISLAACTTKPVSSGTTYSAGSGPGSVQLAWSASSNSPQGYIVEQSTDGVNFTQLTTVASPGLTVTGLASGATYYYRISAYNQSGNSGYTTVLNAAL